MISKDLFFQKDKPIRKTAIVCVIFSILLFVNFLLPNDFLSLLCTGFVCLYILFAKEAEKILQISIYMSFFSYIFLFGNYNLYIFVCLASILRAASIKNKGIVLPLLATFVYFFAHFISCLFSYISVGHFIPLFLISSVIFLSNIYIPKYKNTCINYFILGHIVASILGFLKKYTRLNDIFDADFISVNSWQDTLRYSGLTFDANFYSILCVIVLWILVFDFDYEIKLKARILAILVVGFLGFITYSKSLYLCYAIVFVLSLFNRNIIAVIKKHYRLLVIATVVLLLLFSKQIIQLFGNMAVRFKNISTINDLTSGRFQLWITYIKEIFSSPLELLIGHGISAQLQTAAHNTYLEILYKFGIVGLVSDIMYLLSCVTNAAGKIRKELSSLGLIIIFALMIFFLNAYTWFSFWAVLLIIIIFTKKDAENGNFV